MQAVLTGRSMTAQIPQPIPRNLYPSLRTPFDSEEGVKQTRGFNCFHRRLARRRTMRRSFGRRAKMNWRRKCWEKCGGSGTEEGREEGGRERISFYAFKAVLSTKTTQNGLVKYCAEEGGRKEGKTKRSPHRRRQRLCSNRNMLICWSIGQHPYKMPKGSWDNDVDHCRSLSP